MDSASLERRNSDIGELLAEAAEHAKQPLQRALLCASRRALLWPEEAERHIKSGRSLTDLPSIGPYLNGQILNWLEHPPDLAGVLLQSGYVNSEESGYCKPRL